VTYLLQHNRRCSEITPDAAKARGETVPKGKKGKATTLPSQEKIPESNLPVWEIQSSQQKLLRKDFTAIEINSPREGDPYVDRLTFVFVSSIKENPQPLSMAMIRQTIVDKEGNLRGIPGASRFMTERDHEEINDFVHQLLESEHEEEA
jgi:hypothetical protein